MVSQIEKISLGAIVLSLALIGNSYSQGLSDLNDSLNPESKVDQTEQSWFPRIQYWEWTGDKWSHRDVILSTRVGSYSSALSDKINCEKLLSLGVQSFLNHLEKAGKTAKQLQGECVDLKVIEKPSEDPSI